MSILIEATTPNGDALKQYTLYVNDFAAAHVQVMPHGVYLNWSVYGPQQWPEAKLVLEGLLELSLLADQLTLGVPHDKVHRRKKDREEGREEGDENPGKKLEIRYGSHRRNKDGGAVGRVKAREEERLSIASIQSDREEGQAGTAGKSHRKKLRRARRNGSR